MRFANDVIEDLEGIPYGDPEKDHTLLDRYTLETLTLCLSRLYDTNLDGPDDLSILVETVLDKHAAIEELWYA